MFPRKCGVSALVVSTLLLGCKARVERDPTETNGSAVKTVDAIAGTEKPGHVNDCNGVEAGLTGLDASFKALAQRQITYQPRIKDAVERAFTAVPTGIVKAALLLGYEVQYRDDAATACNGTNRQGLPAGIGCAKVSKEMVGNQQGEKVTLVMSGEPEDVGHATLLGMLMLVSEKLARLKATSEGTIQLMDDEDSVMTDFRRELALEVLHSGLMRGITFPPLAAWLPTGEFMNANTTGERRTELWNAYRATAEGQKNAKLVEMLVYANVGDSYHCNVETNSELTKWGNARALWQQAMVPDLAKLAELGGSAALPPPAQTAAVAPAPVAKGMPAMPTAEPDKPSSEVFVPPPVGTDGSPEKIAEEGVVSGQGEGFALWGRWGPGNGPVRQMFANRVEQTGFLFPRLHGLRRGWDGSGNWYLPPPWGEGRIGWRVDGTGQVWDVSNQGPVGGDQTFGTCQTCSGLQAPQPVSDQWGQGFGL